MTSKNSDQLLRRILGTSRPRRVLLAVFVIVVVLGAVQMASSPGCPIGVWAHRSASPKTSGPAQVTITPGPNAHGVDPVAHVTVKADAGTLTDVRMVNEGGKSIQGVMTPDNTVWKPTVPLGYGRTYTLTVTSRGPNGVASNQVSSFTTLQPSDPDQGFVYHHVRGRTARWRHLRRRNSGGGALRRADRRPGRRRATADSDHQPQSGGFVVLGRRPKRPLATRALLRTGHDGHRRGQDLWNCHGRRFIRASR